MFGIDDAIMIPALASGASSLLGAGMSMFGKKRPDKTTQLQNYTPGQMQDMDRARQIAMQGIENPYEGFQPIADQAMSRFQSDIVPGLAERFSSMGGGARGSSAYQGALSRAGAGLSRDLAAQQSQYGLQRLSGMQGLLGMGLRPQFENTFRPGGAGSAQRFGSGLFNNGMQSLMQLPEMFNQQRAQSGFNQQGVQDKRDFKKTNMPTSSFTPISYDGGYGYPTNGVFNGGSY